MADPLSISGLQAGQLASPLGKSSGMDGAGGATQVGGKSFKDTLLDSLDQVNKLQQEASAGIEKVATGETDNMAEVFTAVRKADVAFSMLMEMRNKLVDAYREIQQMRV
jgi:flagellar hook-basal body complex protein FliE